MTRVTQRAFKSVAVAASLFTVASCSKDAPGGETGGTMIVVLPAEPKTLFPPLESSTQGTMIMTQIFDRLALLGDNLDTRDLGNFKPALATSWTWAPDSMSIAFTLDSAAKWHDGQPLVAEDVRYTFRTYTSPSVPTQVASHVSNIDSVSVRDPHTAVFWFKRRTPQQLFDATYHMFILPSHILAQVPDSALATHSFGQNPVGTGRFRLANWDRTERIEIVADTANSRGRAKLDRVVFSFTTDAGAATIRLFSGDADLFESVSPDNFEQVIKAPNLRLVATPNLQFQFLGFNLRDPKDTSRAHPIFGDAYVRRALLLATDRDRLARSLFDTLGLTSIGPVPRMLTADTTNFTRPSFSLERARALLDSAGWVDRDNDGIREKNGVRLSFEVLAPATSIPRQRAAVQLAQQYGAVGAELKPVTVDLKVMGERVQRTGSFDAYMGGFIPTPGLRGIPGAWFAGGRQNVQRYSNREFETSLNLALSSFDETESRRALGRALQIIWDDAPAVWLYEPATPIGMHKRIQPASIRADGWYVTLADWSIDPAQRIDRDRIGLRGESN